MVVATMMHGHLVLVDSWPDWGRGRGLLLSRCSLSPRPLLTVDASTRMKKGDPRIIIFA
jgi:hypothetical protein